MAVINTDWSRPVYVLGLRQIVDHPGTLPETPGSWMFLACRTEQGVSPYVTAGSDATPEMSRVLRGPQVDVDALTKAMSSFIAGSKGQGVAAQVPAGQQAEAKPTGYRRGPKVDKTIRAMREIESQLGDDEAGYEVRILTIPGLVVEAFWIKSPEGAQDAIVPYVSLWNQLKPMQRYEPGKFLEIIAELAGKQLKATPVQERRKTANLSDAAPEETGNASLGNSYDSD
jgi:hypothetical protein